MFVSRLVAEGKVVGYRFASMDFEGVFDVSTDILDGLKVQFRGDNVGTVTLKYHPKLDAYVSDIEVKMGEIVRDVSEDIDYIIHRLALGPGFVHANAIRKHIQNKLGEDNKVTQLLLTTNAGGYSEYLFFISGNAVPYSIDTSRGLRLIDLSLLDKEGKPFPSNNVHGVLDLRRVREDYKILVDDLKKGELVLYGEPLTLDSLANIVHLSRHYRTIVDVVRK